MNQPTDVVGIEASGLGKWYEHGSGAAPLLRRLVGLRAAAKHRSRALEGIDLSLQLGESLVIVGKNGSGKTTLLRVLAGALAHDEGELRVEGRVTSLIDLGTGIDPEFSGRENALLLGIMAGQSHREISGRLAAIQAFSGLAERFDQPVKTYSSGMTMRLAFAVATSCEPDILLIDEVLAVGDLAFQQRCLRRVRELRGAGCITVLVTHDPAAATRFAESAILLEGGRIRSAGATADVLREYLRLLHSHGEPLDEEELPNELEPAPELRRFEPARSLPLVDERHGSGSARIVGLELRDDAGRSQSAPAAGRRVHVVITTQAHEDVAEPIIGFSLRDRLGEIVSATNTAHEGHRVPALAAGDELSIQFSFCWPPLAAGPFSLSPAIANGDLQTHAMCDWVDNAMIVQARNPSARYGTFSLDGVELAISVGRESRQ